MTKERRQPLDARRGGANPRAELPADRSGVRTEQRNERTMDLHALSTADCVRVIQEEDRAVLEAMERARPALVTFIEAAEPGFQRGGRLIYVGAGTSGRLGALDASEAPPTFQVEPGRVVGIIAGGDAALRRSSEGEEDEYEGAWAELVALNLTADDAMIGIAAGGTTPYVLGALEFAAKSRAGATEPDCASPVPPPQLDAAVAGQEPLVSDARKIVARPSRPGDNTGLAESGSVRTFFDSNAVSVSPPPPQPSPAAQGRESGSSSAGSSAPDPALKACRPLTALITCSPMARPAFVDHLLILETGPEVITGSTRMKAGTATKLALNTISTTLMIRSGRVYQNLMVDLRATNAKLRDRAARIVGTLTGAAREEAFDLLAAAGGAAKTAVVMRRRGVDRAAAEIMLRDASGRLDRVLDD